MKSNNSNTIMNFQEYFPHKNLLESSKDLNNSKKIKNYHLKLI